MSHYNGDIGDICMCKWNLGSKVRFQKTCMESREGALSELSK